jgi:putative tryptophan/tyrosine transport system substrate-binding protein
MDRRAFLGTLAGGLLAAPLAAEAQQADRVARIGFLFASPGSPNAPTVVAFREGLRDLGWLEGRNLVIEYRWANGHFDRLPVIAAELVRLKVDVIAASTTPAAIAAKKATDSIPIVGLSLTNPVGLGLIASIAHPGGNVTGVSYSLDPEIFGKHLALLTEAVPKVRRVAVLSNPAGPAQPATIRSIQDAARSLGVQVLLVDARGPTEFDSAFAMLARERPGAVFVVMDPTYIGQRARLPELATRNRLPSMFTQAVDAEAGGLMSFGPSLPSLYRRAATHVDKILKGAKPADLPVEQATKFDLVINLKTAKALGLTIPPSLLQRADQVIE